VSDHAEHVVLFIVPQKKIRVGVFFMLRQIQSNLHAVVTTLWSSLVRLGHRGETLEDLERHGEALVESSASFLIQVSLFRVSATYSSLNPKRSVSDV
jgi:hypothetical protein